MVDGSRIKGQMEIKGSDGKHVGTVDSMEGQRVRLASGGTYHFIDIAMIESIEGGAVRLKKTAQEVTQNWH